MVSALDFARSLLKQKTSATRIAVVGASNDPEKYGHIIVRHLSGQGYGVLPVNPKGGEIAGLPAWKRLEEVPDPVHVVDFVTPPEVTRKVIETLDPSRFPVLWFQDGSFDDEVVRRAEERFPHVVHHACIMVVTRTL